MVPLKASSYLSWAHDPYLMWFDEALKWVAFEKPVFGFFSLPGVKLAIWLLAVMWAFGVVWCAIWVGRSFIHESFTVFWPIKVGLWSWPARATLLTALLPAQMILVMALKHTAANGQGTVCRRLYITCSSSSDSAFSVQCAAQVWRGRAQGVQATLTRMCERVLCTLAYARRHSCCERWR